MSVSSRFWQESVKGEVFRAVKQAPRPKGSGKGVKGVKVRYTDLFPDVKPGAGFSIYGGKAKRGESGSDSEGE